ncbi:high-affinity nickel-transport protein [Cytobacillus oceanisediminis]|jgi:high-affinity nickel-transport protein|uniref:High-affinity nickel-transport protein n=1 Tax=Cytobacillus oceanisediminis TaxID=665099 RepID=A0A2V3A5D4_9BACI|nr:High-affinity nickel-transporter [Cytobacillus oceanisediminis]PWW32089.1 high-affinity nickel-transport protein [Cytobacillus oceanisediminis]
MELVTFALLSVLIGIRHGLDSDHVAAIADMIGSEGQRNKQLSLGVMYAIGHGAIVLVIGLITLFIGTRLPEEAQLSLEVLVSITLLILGGVILYSIFKNKHEYEFKSRITIVFEFLSRINEKLGFSEVKASPISLGLIGAFLIGIIHGIGVESPTQVAAITSAVGFNNLSAATAQLVLFVTGLLLSTICITLVISWGFLKSKLRRKLFLILGSVTGIYSIGLGVSMLYELVKGGGLG